MRADTDIERDVKAELKWAPDVWETDIAVKATDGVVTLTGYAANAHEKYRAEAAAKRVAGVTAVANDLAVRAPLGGMPTDPEIARDAVAALKLELPLLWENIKPIVKEGHVALEGTVEWNDQRERAHRCRKGGGGCPRQRSHLARGSALVGGAGSGTADRVGRAGRSRREERHHGARVNCGGSPRELRTARGRPARRVSP